MEATLILIVGILFSSAFFLMLQGDLVKLIIGLSLLSNAANLLIFASGRITRGTPPIIPQEVREITVPFANPLPEAMILTAIVIGFGLLAFTVVLVYRAHVEFRSIRSDEITHDVIQILGKDAS